MTLSLSSALSGLSVHQKMLDVVSNNLANANTPGFKRSSLGLSDRGNTIVREALAPSTSRGGTNPVQVGGGVAESTTIVEFSQGTLNNTGRNLDLAIQGDGFFVANDGKENQYTRVGSFGLDKDNSLVDLATGFHVQGRNGNIVIEQNEPLPPTQTGEITLKGNLDADTPVPGGEPVKTSISVIDVRGGRHTVNVDLTRTSAFDWQLNISLPDNDGVISDGVVQGITFNENGSFLGVTGGGIGNNNVTVTWNGLVTPQNMQFDLGTAGSFAGLTQLGGESTAAAVDQDGFESGNLSSISIQQTGVISGLYNNGQIKDIDQLVLATFTNDDGLAKADNNMYLATANSGQPVLGPGLTGRAGAVLARNLESSNVDVAREFAQMIIAQRGFQVNARVVTVSSENLQEVSNLIR